MVSNESALVNIAQGQAQNAQQLYGIAEPGLVTAEQQYESLASGDPAAIARVLAPTAQAASSAAAGAKSNIMANAPAGGEKSLALEQVDAGRASQIAQTTSAATTGAPNALATLAGQGVGEGIQSANVGIGGLSAASQSAASLGGLQLQSQQIQAEEKGNVLGSVSSLAGAGMRAAGAAGSFGDLFGMGGGGGGSDLATLALTAAG
jgi:hypothetical protein